MKLPTLFPAIFLPAILVTAACSDNGPGGGTDAGSETGGGQSLCSDGSEPQDIGRWSEVFDWSDIQSHMDCAGEPDCETGSRSVVAVHAVHLHTGKVLIWPESEAYLYDWKTRTFSYAPTRFNNVLACTNEEGESTKIQCETDADCEPGETCEETVYDSDIFCAGHTPLPDGRILVVGGNNTGAFEDSGLGDVLLFDPDTESWSLLNSLAKQRWYPTATALAEGGVFIMGGTNAGEVEIYDLDQPNGQTTVLPELYPFTNPLVQNEVRLTGILYPFVFQLWDGRLFVGGAEDSAGPDQWNGVVLDPQTGEWFDNPITEVKTSNIPGGAAVMYAPNMIMKAGGGDQPGPRTEVIDLSAEDYLAQAQWEVRVPMNHARHFSNFVILADGTVAAIGGNSSNNGDWGQCGGQGSRCYPVGDYYQDMTGWSPNRVESIACAANICSFLEGQENDQIVNCQEDGDCDFLGPPYSGECDNQPDECVFVDNADFATKVTEIWHPDPGRWCEAATQEKERMYHSTALLLPDGTVLSTGSGARQGLIQQQNAEIYEPPYLFRGPRPKLALPLDGQVVQHGQILSVTLDTSGGAPTSDQIQEAALIRLGSTTHQFDMAQRRIPLTITDRPSDELVELEVEPNSFDLPPGWYMLFILSDQGVPAVAPYVRVEES
ncbi:glyoxal oxidase [Enhygromyxa salina]|nr:glyoxal oxidase [Enhygromyxa salina]